MAINNREQVKEIPVGAKIISVLYYIIAALGVITLILGSFTVLGGTFEGSSPNYALIILFAVLLLGFSILSFFIGKGLWEGDKWSRVIVIVISILSIIVTIVAIIVISYLSRSMFPLNGGQNVRNIVSIFDISKFIPKAIISIINGLIAGYLLFSRKVKESFK